ncbi:hypothetical protein Sgly_0370 [Syntrophobotulus glycolicus DSM 8271]|uniref:DUF3006 domain-containing protein n=1 Tax=Syntrophobotulus glycolicus (strain DSM 8271 / FlGlyR) TaxID=645991 RepID=F0SXJ0_SYNGF|nr:DUF3006 domain-containing protein [Syntrophobotulus glycolicus]ADY54736.1 hypothetical protein Sgly_0370 [Syntrophobotulus glycolicus DSM 8271]
MYIIDRFEGEWAVITTNDRKTFHLPKALFPAAKEGDVIQIKVIVDQAATVQRKDRAKKLFDHFFDEEE